MAEPSNAAGRVPILGVNQLQHSVDSLAKSADAITKATTAIASAVGRRSTAAAAGGIALSASQTRGSTMLSGNVTGTNPQNEASLHPNPSTGNGGSPSFTKMMHRQKGEGTLPYLNRMRQAMMNPSSHADLHNVSTGAVRGMARGLALTEAGSAVGAMSMHPSQTGMDLLSFNTMLNQYNGGRLSTQTQRDIWGNRNWQAGAQNGADFTAAAGIAARMGYNPGSAGFSSAMTGATVAAMASPGSSAASMAQFMAKTQTAKSGNMMVMMGLRNTQKDGSATTPMQLATQILDRMLPNWRSGNFTADQIHTFVYNPNLQKGLVTQLNMMVMNGMIDGDQMSQIQTMTETLLKGIKVTGGSSQKLQDLLKVQGTDKNARKALQKAGIADSDVQALQNAQGAGRTAEAGTIGSFNAAVKASAGALEKFNEALGWIINNVPGAAQAVGAKHGLSASGVTGKIGGSIGGALKGAGAGALIGMAIPGLGEIGVGEVGGAVVGGALGLLGIGGNNDSRMSSTGGPGGGSGGGGASSSTTSFKLAYPTNCRTISATFGQAGGKWSSGHHTGVDFPVSIGTPVMASADGTVVSVGGIGAWAGPYAVAIDHGNGVTTIYAHLSSASVSSGAKVAQGKTLGSSGDKGNVTGPHLHFEVRVNGKAVDPQGFLSGTATVSTSGSNGTASDSSVGSSGNKTSGKGTNFANGSAVSGYASGPETYHQTGSMGRKAQAASGSSNGASSSNASSTGRVSYSPGSGVEQWRGTMSDALKAAGLNPTPDLINLGLHQMQTESGGNPNAVNTWDSNALAGHPSQGLMQDIQSTFDKWAGPYKSKGILDPMANIYASIMYSQNRYGSLQNAWKGHGYAKGAWDIPGDEVAQVHKGEMIIPKNQAQQIREVLLNNTAHSAGPNRGGNNGGVSLVFSANSINLQVGAGATETQARSIGRAFVDSVFQDQRIRSMQGAN